MVDSYKQEMKMESKLVTGRVKKEICSTKSCSAFKQLVSAGSRRHEGRERWHPNKNKCADQLETRVPAQTIPSVPSSTVDLWWSVQTSPWICFPFTRSSVWAIPLEKHLLRLSTGFSYVKFSRDDLIWWRGGRVKTMGNPAESEIFTFDECCKVSANIES